MARRELWPLDVERTAVPYRVPYRYRPRTHRELWPLNVELRADADLAARGRELRAHVRAADERRALGHGTST